MVDVPVNLKLNINTAELSKLKRTVGTALGGSFTGGMRAGIGLSGGQTEPGAMNKIGRAFGTMGTMGLMLKGINQMGGTLKSIFRYSPAVIND